MPMLSALLNRCAFSVSAEEESSFWMSMPNSIMMPIAANEPAMVTVETVEVVTVEIMVSCKILSLGISIRRIDPAVNKICLNVIDAIVVP